MSGASPDAILLSGNEPAGESYARVSWRRFGRSRLALVAVWYIVVMAAIALLAPFLATSVPLLEKGEDGWRSPALTGSSNLDATQRVTSIAVHAPVPLSPTAIDLSVRLSPPSWKHPLGTDDLGRDVLSRMIHGARISLAVGLLATLIALVAGSFLGAIAGYYGGVADWIVSRLIEVVLCFPFLFLVLAIVALSKPSIYTVMIALGLTSWTSEARLIRGEFLRIRELEFAEAARASGAGDARIIFRHLLPNALAPVLVSASFGVATAILTESALSFLGLGVPLPMASWGSILASSREHIDYAWWLVVFPGLAIFTTVAAFNLAGERLRETLDPRSV